jgi:peptide/nickel transport system permease protein
MRQWWTLVLLGWMSAALVGSGWLVDVNHIDLSRMFATPAAELWLGADDLGRAIGPRVIAGAAISCPVALLVVTISLGVGTMIGVLTGWMYFRPSLGSCWRSR